MDQDVVHHGLEGCRGVAQAEEHHSQFIQPAVGGKGGLPFVTFLNPNVIEVPAEVQPGEPLGLTQLGQDVRDEGEWVGVLHCDFVELAVILD